MPHREQKELVRRLDMQVVHTVDTEYPLRNLSSVGDGLFLHTGAGFIVGWVTCCVVLRNPIHVVVVTVVGQSLDAISAMGLNLYHRPHACDDRLVFAGVLLNSNNTAII